MAEKIMAGVSYLGRGVIKITLGTLPDDLKKEARRRGYRKQSGDSSLYKYVDMMDWGIEVGWILQNKDKFDKSNLDIFMNNLKSIEKAADTKQKDSVFFAVAGEINDGLGKEKT